jgi:hypothetical protein
MNFSLSPSVTLVPGHVATFAITGLSCYHRRAFANNSSKDLYATDTLAPLCTDGHPNTIVTRRTSRLSQNELSQHYLCCCPVKDIGFNFIHSQDVSLRPESRVNGEHLWAWLHFSANQHPINDLTLIVGTDELLHHS